MSLIYILLLEKLRRPAQFTLNIIQIDELYGTLTEGQGRTSFLYFRNIEIWFVSFMNRFNVYWSSSWKPTEIFFMFCDNWNGCYQFIVFWESVVANVTNKCFFSENPFHVKRQFPIFGKAFIAFLSRKNQLCHFYAQVCNFGFGFFHNLILIGRLQNFQ